MPDPAVSIIVVTHNHAAYLRRCLEAALREAAAADGEVIVIDNRSADGCAGIAAEFPAIRLEVNARRFGFAANANRGMSLARGECLMLLNPDTELGAGSVATLAEFLRSHPAVGLCGPRLLYPDGTRQPSARRFPSPWTALVRRSPLRAWLRDSRANRRHLMLDAALGAPQPVDWLLGACLVVRRAALEAAGPMDEGYGLYVEDIDWARRMHQGGWAVFYVPSATVIHYHQAESDRRLFSRHAWLHMRSMLRYARKYWAPRWTGLGIRGERSDRWRAP